MKLSKPVQLIVLILGGVILILISIILKNQTTCSSVIFDLLNSIGQALIIGPALSWILDLESMVNYFKKITINSLISKEYLSELPREQLLELRKTCTAKIHLKDAESIEKGLINLDESVCDLLTKPYLERYRQNTNCNVDGEFFVKRHYMEEYIINPLDNNAVFKEFPKTHINFNDPTGTNNPADLLKILRVTIKVDGGEEKDITATTFIKCVTINDAEFLFDTVLSWVDANGKDLEIPYNKSLLINRVFEVRTPKADKTFIKRVTMPTKSLKIDYTYNGNDLKLIGSCFGTLSYSNDNGMKVIQDDNYISIESFNWLLPGNGIFIVKTKK